jgi:hypothetical protein
MHRLLIGFAAFAACGAAAAQDRELSYTFAEAGFYRLDIDNADQANGLSIAGSYAFGPNWFAFGEFDLIELEFVGVSADTEGFRLGAGGYWEVASGIDAIARVGWVDFNVDQAGGQVVDDSGPLLAVGGRLGMSDNRTEVRILARYSFQ